MSRLIIGESLSKVYKTADVLVNALKDVPFSIEQGAFLAVIGPSGSGKTTLLNLIGCLDKPSGGRILVAGKDISRFGKTKATVFRGKHIEFNYQSFNLIPVLTAYENVEYPLFMVRNTPSKIPDHIFRNEVHF